MKNVFPSEILKQTNKQNKTKNPQQLKQLKRKEALKHARQGQTLRQGKAVRHKGHLQERPDKEISRDRKQLSGYQGRAVTATVRGVRLRFKRSGVSGDGDTIL